MRCPAVFWRALRLTWLALTLSVCTWAARAASPHVIEGRDAWLFSAYDLLPPQAQAKIDQNLDLIAQAQKAFKAQGVELVVLIIPSKLELYETHWAEGQTLPPWQRTLYAHALARLRAAGGSALDLKTPLLEAARHSDALFFKLDTHWTPTGADQAAQALAAQWAADPKLKVLLDELPPVSSQLKWRTLKKRSPLRDLAKLAGPPYSNLPAETFAVFQFSTEAQTTQLLAAVATPGIVLAGSSFSSYWTGFADALRFHLQRDILNFIVEGDAGPWFVMKSYLESEHWRTARPKVMFWEILERVLLAGPEDTWRAPQYQMSREAWLQALTQATQKAAH